MTVSLMSNDNDSRARRLDDKDTQGPRQLSIFDTLEDDSTMDNILCEIRDTDLSNITPMDAMNLVNRWQQKISDKW